MGKLAGIRAGIVRLSVFYPGNRCWSVLGGYSMLWGGDVFATSPNSDADFAYLQMQIKC